MARRRAVGASPVLHDSVGRVLNLERAIPVQREVSIRGRPQERRDGEGLLSPVGAQSSHLQCPRTQLPDVCRGPLQLPLRPEPAVLQVGVPHRQVRPWTRAPPIDPVDQAREAALLTLVPHLLRVGTYRLTVYGTVMGGGCFLV